MRGIGTKRADREAVDGLLDLVVAGESPAEPSGPHALLFDAARDIREALRADLPATTVARHVAAIERFEPAAARPARPRMRRLAVAMTAVLVLVVGGSATAAAARNALPGDLLYPVKRAVEAVNLALHPSAASKGRIHLAHAGRRLAELEALLARPRAGENVDVGAAMRAYAAELSAAEHDLLRAVSEGAPVQGLLAVVEARIHSHLARLTVLRDQVVPAPARPAIQRGIERARTAEERVERGRRSAGQQDGTAPGRSGEEHPTPQATPPGRSDEAPGQSGQSSSRAPTRAGH